MNLVTDKQIALIKRLVQERDTTEIEPGLDMARAYTVAGRFSSNSASKLITMLLDCPKVATDTPDEPAAGVYSYCGDQYARVYFGKESGRMLAKRIHMEQDGGEWMVSYEYLGLASRVLTPDTEPQRLTVEEVGSLGITTCHCLMCGRRLDDPESVDRGIGPVCADKYGA